MIHNHTKYFVFSSATYKIVILAGCITLLMTVELLLCGIHFSF